MSDLQGNACCPHGFSYSDDYVGSGRAIGIASDGCENPQEHCWCGAFPSALAEDVLGRSWCRPHAPRCRSGAHFHGNCECVGDQSLRKRSKT